jgi:ABC-type transport system involved in multi-copper enzyme maturation permease subunit
MFFGPIVSLEMVTGARRARYFVVRVLYALVLLVVLWITYAETWGVWAGDGSMSIQAAAAFSSAFFATFTIVQLSAVLLLTPAMIAGSIAQERERRTIEYMLASTLTGSEIVLSKFLARTLHVASLLLAGLPILAIAMMLGGIDPQLLIIAFVITLATLVVTASLSIGTSVWAKRSRDAVVRTYVFLLVFLILPPLAWTFSGAVWGWLTWLPDAGELVSQVNPYVVLSKALSLVRPVPGMGTYTPWQPIWPLLAVYAAFSAIVLAWSITSVRRVYRKSIGAGEGVRRLGGFRFRWRPRLGVRPMLWKELFAATAAFQLGTLGRVAVALLFLAAVVPAITLFYELVASSGVVQAREAMAGTSTGVVAALGCLALLVVMIRAAGSITAEKERDSWLSLISTPLTPAEIIWAKIAGGIYAARWFALPAAIWWGLTAMITPDFMLVMPILLATFGCVALALSALGVWFSSWCRTSIRAMASCVAVGVFLGGGYLLCCVPLMFRSNGGDEIFSLAACIPFLLAAPGILWMAYIHDPNPGQNEAKVMIAYVLGTACYLALGLLMTAVNIRGFDDRVGRPQRKTSLGPQDLARPPKATVQAEAKSPQPGARAAAEKSGHEDGAAKEHTADAAEGTA